MVKITIPVTETELIKLLNDQIFTRFYTVSKDGKKELTEVKIIKVNETSR